MSAEEPVKRQCGTCRCWKAPAEGDAGECRLRPRVPVYVERQLRWLYPAQHVRDTCAAWQGRKPKPERTTP